MLAGGRVAHVSDGLTPPPQVVTPVDELRRLSPDQEGGYAQRVRCAVLHCACDTRARPSCIIAAPLSSLMRCRRQHTFEAPGVFLVEQHYANEAGEVAPAKAGALNFHTYMTPLSPGITRIVLRTARTHRRVAHARTHSHRIAPHRN